MPGPFELIIIGMIVLIPLALGFGIYAIVKADFKAADRERREDE